MKLIYKLLLNAYATEDSVVLPAGSRILSCDFQGEDLVMWYLCDPTKPLSDEKKLLIIRTGQEFPSHANESSLRFIGTAYDRNLETPFVIHLFEYAIYQP